LFFLAELRSSFDRLLHRLCHSQPVNDRC
jgi:hypothetical protein